MGWDTWGQEDPSGSLEPGGLGDYYSTKLCQQCPYLYSIAIFISGKPSHGGTAIGYGEWGCCTSGNIY